MSCKIDRRSMLELRRLQLRSTRVEEIIVQHEEKDNFIHPLITIVGSQASEAIEKFVNASSASS